MATAVVRRPSDYSTAVGGTSANAPRARAPFALIADHRCALHGSYRHPADLPLGSSYDGGCRQVAFQLSHVKLPRNSSSVASTDLRWERGAAWAIPRTVPMRRCRFNARMREVHVRTSPITAPSVHDPSPAIATASE